MAANGISTLTIPPGLVATSYTQASSYLVAVGTFNYDAYGNGFAIRKDSGMIDSYMNQVLALGIEQARVYSNLTFSYGQAEISFTLEINGTFSNVTCPYGAGGYSASSGQIVMPGNQLLGGTSPANDITWDYVCAANDGVITGFTYSSGTPPSGPRNWTFVPGNGQPSFTRSMFQPTGTETSIDPADSNAALWNITTADSLSLQGSGAGKLNPSLIPNGTSFSIYVTSLGNTGNANKQARQLAKLDLAAADRAASGNPRATYDITQLPTQYVGNIVVDNPNVGGLITGRPWIT